MVICFIILMSLSIWYIHGCLNYRINGFIEFVYFMNSHGFPLVVINTYIKLIYLWFSINFMGFLYMDASICIVSRFLMNIHFHFVFPYNEYAWRLLFKIRLIYLFIYFLRMLPMPKKQWRKLFIAKIYPLQKWYIAKVDNCNTHNCTK